MVGGGEEGAGEGPVGGGDGDEHDGIGGPDVQVVGVDGEAAVFGGGSDVEFAPELVDVLLLVGEVCVLH